MKNASTLLFLLFLANMTLAQEKIAVIDYKKVIDNSQAKFEFDYAYAEIDSFVMQLGREQIIIYQKNLQVIMKRIQGGCASLEETEKMEEDAKNQERKMMALDKFAKDTLAFFRQNLNYEVHKIIQKEIEEYGKFSGFKFIGDANQVYFHVAEIKDISYPISFQLKQKYKLPQHKSARRQAIYNIKERYNLNQDLRERFSYMTDVTQ